MNSHANNAWQGLLPNEKKRKGMTMDGLIGTWTVECPPQSGFTKSIHLHGDGTVTSNGNALGMWTEMGSQFCVIANSVEGGWKENPSFCFSSSWVGTHSGGTGSGTMSDPQEALFFHRFTMTKTA
jgi:hypothetical protein